MMETDIDLILPVYNPDEGWELTVVSKYKELEDLVETCRHSFICGK